MPFHQLPQRALRFFALAGVRNDTEPSRLMRYELYYWPTMQGRGEFVRLALEEAGADYVDVARRKGKAGVAAMMKIIDDQRSTRPPFAPPFLKAGKLIIAQTANILFYLGPRLNLSPRDEAGRLWAHQRAARTEALSVMPPPAQNRTRTLTPRGRSSGRPCG